MGLSGIEFPAAETMMLGLVSEKVMKRKFILSYGCLKLLGVSGQLAQRFKLR